MKPPLNVQAAIKRGKKTDAKRDKTILLTTQQATFVGERLKGKDRIDAARTAGYKQPVSVACTVEKTTAVQRALREARDELSSAAQIKRADVIDGIMEAINMARLGSDPATMIKGWTEVGKILGHYAPEVKKVEMSMNAKRLQSKYEAMSDEDLVRIIEGEYEEVANEVSNDIS